jgi:anthranilate phosphoribosyltransferase
MADALSGLPIRRAFVVHGEPGWDEPTPAGAFLMYDVRPGQVSFSTRSAADFGLPSCAPEDLRGGDAAFNAAALRAVFAGEDRGAHRNALLMSAALALELTGAVENPVEGVSCAQAAIDSGSAAELLRRLAEFGARL